MHEPFHIVGSVTQLYRSCSIRDTGMMIIQEEERKKKLAGDRVQLEREMGGRKNEREKAIKKKENGPRRSATRSVTARIGVRATVKEEARGRTKVYIHGRTKGKEDARERGNKEKRSKRVGRAGVQLRSAKREGEGGN